jgi:integrase/recombinase XerD
MTKPISPLRQRMIDDMTMRNLSANTQETYIRSVAQFSAFHRRSPDKLGVEHVRDFHLHLVSRGLVANSIAVKMAALRFFYGTTLRRPDIAAEIPTPRRPDRLPAVLARAEVERLLKAVGDLKLRTALMTIYSAGLRISEAMRLTAQDIDSVRMVICVRQGKGRKDRYTVPIRPAARHSSQLLASDTAIALAVSRPQSGPADNQAGVAIGLPACGRGRRAEQVGHSPHVATQFCDPPA